MPRAADQASGERGERPGEADIDVPTQLLGSSHHHRAALDSPSSWTATRGRPPAWPLLSTSRTRTSRASATATTIPGSPAPDPRSHSDIVLGAAGRSTEAIEDVALPDPSSVRTRDRPRAGPPGDQELLVPVGGCGLRGVERDPELRGLPSRISLRSSMFHVKRHLEPGRRRRPRRATWPGWMTTRRSAPSPSLELSTPSTSATAVWTILRRNGFIGSSVSARPVRQTRRAISRTRAVKPFDLCASGSPRCRRRPGTGSPCVGRSPRGSAPGSPRASARVDR